MHSNGNNVCNINIKYAVYIAYVNIFICIFYPQPILIFIRIIGKTKLDILRGQMLYFTWIIDKIV